MYLVNLQYLLLMCKFRCSKWDAKKRMHLSYATSQAVSDRSMVKCLETRKCTLLNVA